MRRFVLALTLGLATVGQAQELRVRVADPEGRSLIVGALVTLKSSEGTEVIKGVTNDLGRVRLRAPAGKYGLMVERPGFLDTTYAVEVPAGLDSILVGHARRRPPIPASLVAVPARCEAPGITDATRGLWIEVDRALRVVSAGEQAGLLSLSVAAFERRVSLTQRVEVEQVNTLLGRSNGPGTTRVTSDLLQRGLMLRGDSLEWSAPEVSTFLDPAFLSANCFGISSGALGREGLVGLRFAPRNLDVVGMTGTFWIDPSSRELTVVDYTFANLPKEWRADRLGGSIEVNRFAPGFWIARFWHQRTPNVVLPKDGGNGKVRSIRERGGEVTGVTVVVDTTDRVATAIAIQQQLQATRARIAKMTGTVVDTLGYPVSDAEVAVLGTSYQTNTSSTGQFELDGLPLGLQIARVRKIGYRVQYTPIRLAAGDEWTGKIRVKKLPQLLGEIVVVGKYGKPAQYANTAKYDDFYRRRAGRVGKYLTREDIDKRAAVRISELLTGLPGVRIGFDRPGGDEIEIVGCQGQPSIWIDGQRMSGTTQELLRVITPTDIEAMEIYTRESQIPAEYREGTCAAIVLWTR